MATSLQDTFTVTKKISTIYSDFLNNFVPHPGNKQLIKIVNEDAVKNSIANLINTNKYSRFFQPTVGSNVRKLLFKNISEQTKNELAAAITETIVQHEPRAQLQGVVVTPFSEQNYYQVDITFFILNKSEPVVLTQILYRVR